MGLAQKILTWLQQSQDSDGSVRGLMSVLATQLGANPGDVHEALIHLKRRGDLRASSIFQGDEFEVTLAGLSDCTQRVLEHLKREQDQHGTVRGWMKDLSRSFVGCDVQRALIQLRTDGVLQRSSVITGEDFEVTLTRR